MGMDITGTFFLRQIDSTQNSSLSRSQGRKGTERAAISYQLCEENDVVKVVHFS